MGWLTDELLFYGGMIVAGLSLVAAIICFCVSKMRFITLNAQLTAEYGETRSKNA